MIFAGIASLGVGVYALVKRPRASPTRLFVAGTFATLGGSFVGSYQALESHKRFVKTLDSPQNFFQALENINARAGGRPLGIIQYPPGSQPPSDSISTGANGISDAERGLGGTMSMQDQILQAIATREKLSQPQESQEELEPFAAPDGGAPETARTLACFYSFDIRSRFSLLIDTIQ